MKQHLTSLSVNNKDEVFETIIDELWNKCADGENIDILNEAEKPLIISQLIQDSINGGGINSFFYNNANRYVTSGLEAFQKLGLLKIHELFQNSVNAFPEGYIPEDLEKCRLMLEEWPKDNPTDEKWSELTNQFYDLDDYILNQNIAYIKNNIEKFESH